MTFMIHNFASNLSRLRKEAGISQTELAEKLGIGKQSISDYEKSKSYPTFATLDKIADFFKATPVQLFGTSQDIELEKAVLKTDEYTEKADKIIRAVNAMDDFDRMSYSNDYNHIFKVIEILGNLTKVIPLVGDKGETLYRSKNPFDDELYSKEEIKGKETSYEHAVTTEFDSILNALDDLKNSQLFYDLMYLTRGPQKFTEDGEPLYVDPRYPNRPPSTNFDSGDQYAYDKSPLQLLLENKEELGKLAENLSK